MATPIPSQALSQIVAAVARPADPAALARRAYVDDRKRVQASLTRGLVARGLPYETASRLAVAALRAAAQDTVSQTPELADRISARALAKVETRGAESVQILVRAGDEAARLIVEAAQGVRADARLSAGAREIARTVVVFMGGT